MPPSGVCAAVRQIFPSCPAHCLPDTGSLLLDGDGEKWNTAAQDPENEVWDGVWDLSVLDLERQVVVCTLWEVRTGQLLGGGGELSDGLSLEGSG